MRILIAYSSNTGVTAEIAEHISKLLESKEFIVDLYDLTKCQPDIIGYNLVLIGSGIKMGKWHNSTQSYVEKNKLKIREIPHALFVSCGDAIIPGKQTDAQTKYLDLIAEKYELSPISTGLFAGCYKWEKYNFIVKKLVKSMLNESGISNIDYNKPLDFRDWTQIEKWTTDLI